MRRRWMTLVRAGWIALSAGALAAAGCGAEEPAAQAAAAPVAAPATEATATADAAAEPATLQPTEQSWTPEGLEELLAPVALYPDIIIGQVLVASTNPQEVLDAGNWLIKNESLKGDPLDEAAKKVGFTTPVRVLMQTPEVVDMMCMEMGWTTELGQAFVNDQVGVMDAVQRLRAQAKDVGNLVSSEQLKVETEVQDGKEVIMVSPPNENVVYVPQYDPVAVYAPPPAPAPAAAPAATTTTTTTQEGHSTGTLVTTGLLAFGAGLLVADVFDDDDDWDDYGYYGRPMPYYPPYPYRPAYGGGYYPSHNYNRSGNYGNRYNKNTVVNVDTGDNYFNRYDNKQAAGRSSSNVRSPITEAKGSRPELTSLNQQAKQGPARKAPTSQDAWKGRNSYAGATQSGASTSAQRKAPKVQGSYAGAQRSPRPSGQPSATTGTRQTQTARPSSSQQQYAGADRGRQSSAAATTSRPATASRPTQAQQRPQSQQRAQAPQRSQTSGVSGVNRGSADRAASQRGKQSVSRQSGGRSGGGGGGGRRR